MSDTFELNQRIVYAGLARVCSDRSVLKSAFEDWSKSNSQTPVDRLGRRRKKSIDA